MSIESLAAANRQNAYFDVSRFDRLRGGNEVDFAALLKSDENIKPETGSESDMDKKKPKIDKTDKLYEQCEELEMFFLKTLVSGMRKTVSKSEFTQTGFAGEVYEDMLWDEHTKKFAKNAHFGFAELVYLELTGQRGKVLGQPV